MTPKNKIKFKTQAQTRAISFLPVDGQKRINTKRYVEGYAATYERYLLWDDGERKIYERFERGCFDQTDITDVIMQFDHEGRVFARTTNSTLIVEPNDQGLFMAADLDKTENARNLYEDIDKKMITKMSWRFLIGDYHTEPEANSRDITIVHTRIPKIYDVSAVSIPANDGTEINARDFVHGVMDEVTRREAELEIKRKRLILRTKVLKEI